MGKVCVGRFSPLLWYFLFSLFFDKDRVRHNVARRLTTFASTSKTNTESAWKIYTHVTCCARTTTTFFFGVFSMEKSAFAFGRGPPKASENRRGFLVVLCAKNGKKKKKKKKTNDGGEQQQQQQRDVQPPRRITGKKNGVSVNAQIRLVDRWKKAAASTNEMTSLTGPPERRMRRSESDATTTTTTTRKANANHPNDAYQAELKRRRTLAAEKRKKEREAYLQKMALDANDANLGAFFDASGGGDEGKKTKCFVDGYNVCGVPDEDDARMRVSGKNGSGGGGGGGIPHLRRTFLVEGDLDRARKILEEKAKAFAISRNMECVIVWDNNNYHANNSNSNSSNGRFSEKERAEDVGDGVTVVFTGNGQLADGYIERETKLLAEKKDGENVYVVTSDNAVRMAVSSTTARVIDSANFCREIRDTERDEDAILRELALDARWGGGAKKNKASIGASVLGDASAREKMLKLRETARNSSKAEMNEKLVGKSGSFGRFKQNSNRDKSNATTKTAANKEEEEGERTNVAKRLLVRRARADERNRNNNGSDDGESGSYQRWGSL